MTQLSMFHYWVSQNIIKFGKEKIVDGYIICGWFVDNTSFNKIVDIFYLS